MNRLRFLTAGESHGPGLMGILEGLPAGLFIEAADFDRELSRRQLGFGRGGRMKIEKDGAELIAGIRHGATLGSPVGLLIRNRDHQSWLERMGAAPGGPDPRPVKVPRPGHTDLAGGLKYGHLADLRNVLERASARETAARVAVGAAARVFLQELGIEIGSYVRSIGNADGVEASVAAPVDSRRAASLVGLLADGFETRALDAGSDERFKEAVRGAQARRDTLGGVVEVVVTGLPVGLGSHVQWDRKLDGRLAQALACIPAIKAVELGDGLAAARRYGSQVHDPIELVQEALRRTRNHAGGLEGGITNGEPLVVRIAMKPIATVSAALPSVDVTTLGAVPAHVERSDTCAVPAAGVIAEAMVALVLADALLETFGGDTMESLRGPVAKARLSLRSGVGHLFLVGPMGAGKSAAGPKLAALLQRPFVDLDARIEAHAGATVAELFARGEESFRELEGAALAEVAMEREPKVVALGGGAILRDAAWRSLRETGLTLRLRAEPAELIRRLGGEGREKRPLLRGDDWQASFSELLRRREKFYSRADLTLDVDGLGADAVAGACLGLVRSVEGPLVRTARALKSAGHTGGGSSSEDGAE